MALKMDREDVVGPPTQTRQLGVYRLVTEKPSFSPREQWKKVARGFPTVLRLVKDIYTLSPRTFFLYLFTKIWSTSINPILTLHLSSQVLIVIEDGLKKGRPDGAAILRAVGLRMACLVFTAMIHRWIHKLESKMRPGIDSKLQASVLRSKLATDLTGVQAKRNKSVNERTAWQTFSILSSTIAYMAGAASQLFYVFRTVRSSGHGHGPVFATLCFVGPTLDIVFERSLWSEPHIIEATDPHYLRTKGLLALSDRKYKQDIITGDIVQHITKELRRTIKLLGDTNSSSPYQQYRRLQGTPLRLAIKLASDLPMLYYAGNAIMNPTKFSLSTVATLQQIESLFSWTFQDLFYHAQSFFREANKLQAVYDLEHVVHETKGGDLPYPPLGRPHEQGMPLVLKDVSFSYPGATNKALDNVSLSVKAGQLVVIVGANGSGKSTIVNLLTRLYDATSGSITIDGEDIQKYRIADIRRATAALTQDHHLFPLSLSENIGLGNTAHVSDMDMIRAAAKQGGADGLLTRLTDGFDTVLERPPGLQWGNDVQKCETTLLAEELEKMKKETDISGGERQRLIASRTFMRFTSGAVKLVCVDEPSSSLDPEGEWQLFKNLRQVRDGKTMIFVTHRFAHLTKHADLILCMKEANIIESGTHQELMNIDGEYRKMFNIQADAFD